MFLNSRAMMWLNPVPGTEHHARVKVGSILGAILLIIELMFLILGGALCGSTTHWIFAGGGVFIVSVFVVVLATAPKELPLNKPTDCDWYHELILTAAILVNSQFAFCLGFCGVLRGYAKPLKLSEETIKLLTEIDWIPTLLAMFLFCISIAAYIFFSTREPKPPK